MFLIFLKGIPMNISDLIAQMTLQEKAALCTGATPWLTLGVERLGLKPITMTDGPHGLRRSVDLTSLITDSFPATCFPVAAALASSWDKDLLVEMGQALADECIAQGVDILLGPGMNIKRTPLCGRNFEYFSEDPVLAGEMAAALIKGVQSKGVGTSLKHFAANNQETRRFTVDAVVDERTLHEIYLAGFEIAVKQAQPWTVMCAYNSLNGAFCSENAYLLTGVLRDLWKFEGFVVSDWGAVHDRVAGLRAGLDLEMPGPRPYRVQAVIDAVVSGELDEAVLDRAVERLLTIILRAQQTPKGQTTIDIDAHHALARRIASDCIVLLKNEDHLLPLKGNENLAVIGQAAQTPVFQGGGSSHINSTRVDSPLDLLKERAEVQYTVGDGGVFDVVDQRAIDEAVTASRAADVALLFIALPASIESESYDRQGLDLTPQQVALIQAVGRANPRTVVVLNNGSAIDMRAWIGDVSAVIEAWLPGQAGAGAVIDVLYGDVNPSGKLGETFPLKIQDTPAYLNFPGENNEVRYGEGIFVGYRAYEALGREVLFPFGYGLSYTRFEYSNLRVASTSFTLGTIPEITLDVTNTGPVAGKEIVQLYVHDVQARLVRPPKELKSFAKVALEAGETKRVSFNLTDRAFSYYDPAYGRWLAEAGEFDISIGSSSADIRLAQRVTLTEGTVLPCIINMNSTLGEWLADPRAAELIQPWFAQMAVSGEDEALGMNMATFFLDLPLPVVLAFQGMADNTSPHDIIAGLIAKLGAEWS
jgi:beta-glucosidase